MVIIWAWSTDRHPTGIIRGVGPEAYFATPPKVAADPNRHSLSTTNISNNSTSGSSTLNWMNEFFNTTSIPVGHGFTQTNIDSDFACYTFEPKTNMPIRVIVLDDTCKANVNAQVPLIMLRVVSIRHGTTGLSVNSIEVRPMACS